VFTSIPFFVATVLNVVVNWLGDKALSQQALHAGKRRYLLGLCLVLTSAGLFVPYVESLTAVTILVSIAVTFSNCGPAANAALVSDILRSPADAGRAFAFLVLGGNSFGLCAPIVTGYIVQATGAFSAAFIVAGVLALIGAASAFIFGHGTIGEVAGSAQPVLAD
jgi:dipeptide/tripeptide permease